MARLAAGGGIDGVPAPLRHDLREGFLRLLDLLVRADGPATLREGDEPVQIRMAEFGDLYRVPITRAGF